MGWTIEPRTEPSEPKKAVRRVIWAGWLLLVLSPGLALGLDSADGDEIDIRFFNGAARSLNIEPFSGWPLTLHLTANEEKLKGIGYEVAPYHFPRRDDKGFLVFADPDGCPSWVETSFQTMHENGVSQGFLFYPDCPEAPPVPWPWDEAMLEFDPGLNLPDLPCGDRPMIFVFDPGSRKGTSLKSIGPCVGSAEDSFGYGRNARIPGLVLVADTGPGIVFDKSFNRTKRLQTWNLAGFFHSIAYEMKDARGYTSLVAHMNVPGDLFAPVYLVDRDVEVGCEGASDTMIRIDGGPLECVASEPFPGDHVVTVRAFVINGEAPDRLEDLDGNGQVDLRDAIKAGYDLLSGQAEFRFTQLFEDFIPCLFDFDGNGQVGGVVLPAGPGGMVTPPR